MDAQVTLGLFDRFLHERKLQFEAVIIGGAALNLLGVVHRVTKDVDVLDPAIPKDIADAARQFASRLTPPLDEHWFNDQPGVLKQQLPDGWQSRLRLVFSGEALRLSTLSRIDLLRSKVFALCDRATDLNDCIALSPSRKELAAILPWLEEQDGNPDWPRHVRETVDDLLARLASGV